MRYEIIKRKEVCISCCEEKEEFVDIYIGKVNEFKLRLCKNCLDKSITVSKTALAMFPESMPDYGDVFTIEDFYQGTLDEVFMEDDGHGYYANLEKNEMYKESVRCLDDPDDVHVEELRAKAKGFTHVVWFNQ